MQVNRSLISKQCQLQIYKKISIHVSSINSALKTAFLTNCVPLDLVVKVCSKKIKSDNIIGIFEKNSFGNSAD